MRLYKLFVYLLLVIAAGVAILALTDNSFRLGVLAIVIAFLAIVGIWDMRQDRHSILRNYPIVGHLRWIFEAIRPEFRQYFFESSTSGRPFSRDQRSLVYQRAKDILDRQPFGSEIDFYKANYAWVNHTMAPRKLQSSDIRVTIGEQSKHPYSASIYNISAMSFGALSGKAIEALNKGAKKGAFAHDTGEGSISPYHRQGGDLIWEIGSGYFGCRHDDGSFNPDRFSEQAAYENVKMIEVKLSQGAKPGHGGVLPASKVSPEIAATRGVPEGKDCISPAFHTAFSTPRELLEFIARLKELSGGKPTGFKLCVGHHWEFMAVCKAMLETGIVPDFIVVDGAEGGTGAAPPEFSDHLGMPLLLGLDFVNNTLIGAGLRDQIKLGASGKVVSTFDIVSMMALGADWCNSARGFMFALGCVQSQSCHTNRCPVGVATQDPNRQKALVISDKSERVYNFHRNTLRTLSEFIAAIGLKHPSELRKDHFQIVSQTHRDMREIALSKLANGELLSGTNNPAYRNHWEMADPESFSPLEPKPAAAAGNTV